MPGNENLLADALWRIYSNDSSTTVHARSEYTYHDVVNDNVEIQVGDIPNLDAVEAAAIAPELAETSQPETAKEFASRVKALFVLKGPQE